MIPNFRSNIWGPPEYRVTQCYVTMTSRGAFAPRRLWKGCRTVAGSIGPLSRRFAFFVHSHGIINEQCNVQDVVRDVYLKQSVPEVVCNKCCVFKSFVGYLFDYVRRVIPWAILCYGKTRNGSVKGGKG